MPHQHQSEGLLALARAKFTEQSLWTALRTGTTQYVVLGDALGDFSLREEDYKAKLRCFQPSPTEPWSQILLSSGFSTRRKTLFTWLGRSWKAEEADLRALFSQVAELSAEGSSLLFDCPDIGLFTPFFLQRMLADYGFLLMEYLTPDDIRFLLLDDGPTLTHACLVHAVWKG